ncbi:MAG: hypothetical protein WCJ96_04485 [Verrucomicrobiota bacterium]|jgi:hypothetical protein
MSDDYDGDEDTEDRVQDEVEDYMSDVYPGLDANDPQNQPRSSGCMLILALPALAFWFLG